MTSTPAPTIERVEELSAIVRDNDGTMIELRTRRERSTHVDERELWMRREVPRAAWPEHEELKTVRFGRTKERQCRRRREVGGGRGLSLRVTAGASSRMTCALVPEMPKEEMPARRG